MNSNVFLNELSTVRQTSYTSRATRRDDERSTKSAVVVPEGSHVKENKAPVALISPAAVCRIIKARWDHVPLLWTTWFGSSAFTPLFLPQWGHCFVFLGTVCFFLLTPLSWNRLQPTREPTVDEQVQKMEGGRLDYGLVCSRSSHRGKDSPGSGKPASLSAGQVTRSHQFRVKPSSPVLMVRMGGGLLLCYLEERVDRLRPTSQQGSDRTRTLKKTAGFHHRKSSNL